MRTTFWNSYFAATVVRVDQDKLLVRYEEVIDDVGQKLEEEVDIQHIIPYPPVVEHTISLGDDVDAFDGAGFWRGKVILNRQRCILGTWLQTSVKKHMKDVTFSLIKSAWTLVMVMHGST
ncbi:hypothetical protein LXL04_003801 [Taraxacum kok-saghyz]